VHNKNRLKKKVKTEITAFKHRTSVLYDRC